MSYFEYEARMYAYQLSVLDENEKIYQQAWANQQAKATKEKGKDVVSVYSTFKDLFDKEAQEKELIKEMNGTQDKVIPPNLKKAVHKISR